MPAGGVIGSYWPASSNVGTSLVTRSFSTAGAAPAGQLSHSSNRLSPSMASSGTKRGSVARLASKSASDSNAISSLHSTEACMPDEMKARLATWRAPSPSSRV